MTPPLSPLFQEGIEDTSMGPERRSTSTGEALVNIALGLMREVKEDIKGITSKIDEIAKERRDEAREHGELEARLKALEEFKRTTEATQRSNRALAIAALLAACGTLLLPLAKLLAANPQVLK